MNQEQEQRIRELAYSLWQSAERPYWQALEYWLMAEQMVVELMIATTTGVAEGLASLANKEDQ
jgi:hypothetical protein